MLRVLYSHQLSSLADVLFESLGDSQADIFAQTPIIVQSNGLAQWLRMRMVDQQGICANIDFPFVSSYLWQLARKIPELNIPKHTQFDKPILVWRIMAMFSEDAASLPREAMAYWVEQSPEAQFQFAYQLADVFDQYQLYRPEWLRGEAPLPNGFQWQSELWQRLQAGAANRARPATRFDWLDQLPQYFPTLKLNGLLPEKLSLFGINTLPPKMLAYYAALAQHTEVTLYFLNPSEQYWGDYLSPSELRRQVEKPAEINALLDTQQPLLASMGRLGRDFLDMLLVLEGAGAASVESLDDLAMQSSATSLLNTVQQQIQQAIPPKQLQYRALDDSIEIASHYRPMREIEGLHNRILGWLDEDSSLTPADILVLTTDIDTYAPLAQQYFLTAEPRIPFSVSDHQPSVERTARECLMQLLALPMQRGTLSEVLGLLAQPLISARYGLDHDSIRALGNWLQAAGARWGINAAQSQFFGADTSRANWPQALERLMSLSVYPDGYFLGQASSSFAFDFDEHIEMQLQRFWSFYYRISKFVQRALTPMALPSWVDMLSTLLNQLLSQETTHRQAHAALNNFYQRLREVIEVLPEHVALQEIDLTAFSAFIESQWPVQEGKHGFLSGGVTIASMVPMRSIPRKIICCLGMDEGKLPRQPMQQDIDASAQQYRAGDRNRRLDDRYLFLEILCAAQQKLYLSFNGREPVRNQHKPPSMLINELLDVIAKTSGQDFEACRAQLIAEQPLQGFSPSAFTKTSAPNYQPRQFALAQQILQADSRHLSALPPRWQTDAISDAETANKPIRLTTLQAFWHDPTNLWTQHAVGADKLITDEPWPVSESLEMSPILRRQFADFQTEVLLQNMDAETFVQLLPYANLDTMLDMTDALAEAYRRLYADLPDELYALQQHSRDIILDGQVISADFVTDQSNRLQALSLEKASTHQLTPDARKLFTSWLAHLAHNLSQLQHDEPLTESIFHVFSIDGEAAAVRYVFVPQPDAAALLQSYLEGYRAGKSSLLHWQPEVAAAYVGKNNAGESSGQNHEMGLQAAHEKWLKKWTYHRWLSTLYPEREMLPLGEWIENIEKYYRPMEAALIGSEKKSQGKKS